MTHTLGKTIAHAAIAGIFAGLPACGGATRPETVPVMELPKELPPSASAETSPEPRRERPAAKKASAPTPSDDDSIRQMMGTPADCHACRGMNECKGKGNCKNSKNSCKGQNQCKGLGGCKSGGCP